MAITAKIFDAAPLDDNARHVLELVRAELPDCACFSSGDQIALARYSHFQDAAAKLAITFHDEMEAINACSDKGAAYFAALTLFYVTQAVLEGSIPSARDKAELSHSQIKDIERTILAALDDITTQSRAIAKSHMSGFLVEAAAKTN